MSQIFKQQKQWAQRPGRNNFDLSFDNNFTTKIGQLTPVFVKECMPGDKFQIDASIGLRAMPLAFPVQSPLQAHLSYFWVPNRILWENWKDFVSDTQEHEHPYISIPYTRASEIGTSTLADYLGVPTTYADESGSDFLSVALRSRIVSTASTSTDLEVHYDEGQLVRVSGANTGRTSFLQAVLNRFYYNGNYGSTLSSQLNYNGSVYCGSELCDFTFDGKIRLFYENYSGTQSDFYVLFSSEDPANPGYFNSLTFAFFGIQATYDENSYFNITLTGPQLEAFKTLYPGNGFYISIANTDGSVDLSEIPEPCRLVVSRSYISTTNVSDINNPFVIQSGDSVPDIKLNALIFRAYECIYNSYYRNQNDVDPFIIGGQKQFNRWCTNLGDGADSTTPLYLRNVNYELDYLTSCLLSPQFGDAPLVGVSAVGNFTFEDENGQTYTVIPRIGDDGDTLTGIDAYEEGIPVGSLQRLNSLIKYGISISDFRNVNSLQRFCENQLRRGLKYEDVLKSHYGTTTRYQSVDEPLYLGGMTRTISVTQINATAQSDGIKLGDYVGQAGLFSKQKHNVNHYCDEHGVIIGLLSITPIPTYSQLLPKMFLKDNLLSYPFPLEFRHIGLQPIDYREVTPIQAKVHSKPYTDTFGYQRPYYDFIASIDENHGSFRTDLQGYIFTRNFSEPPALGHKFIEVDPTAMTNPFIDISPDAPTFLGQIHFDVKAKRPLARIHQPRLE